VNPLDDLNRFWNDVVDGAAVDAAAGVDPVLAETVRRFQALDTGPAPAPAFVRDLRAALVGEPPAGTFGPNGTMGGGPATRPMASRQPPRLVRPTRWGAPLDFAAVVLLMIGLVGIFAGGYRALPAIFGERDRSTEDGVRMLVDATFPKEYFDGEGVLSRVTIVPGGRVARPTQPAASGLALEYVVDGTYSVQVNGPLTVVRMGDDGDSTSEAVDAGIEVTLRAGDAVIYHELGAGGVARNVGDDNVILLTVVMVEGGFQPNVGPPAMSGPAGIPLDLNDGQNGALAAEAGFEELGLIGAPLIGLNTRAWPAPLPDAVPIALWSATLGPGETLSSPVPGGVTTISLLTPDVPLLQYDAVGGATNTAEEAVDVVIVTIGPFDEAGDAASPTAEAATPAADGGSTLLIDVSLPTELVDQLSGIGGWLTQLTLEPGATTSRDPTVSRPGFAVELVRSGTYVVRPNGAATVTRAAAGNAPTSEDVPAGGEVTLGPGDTILYHAPTEGGFARNAGDDAVVVLALGFVDASASSLRGGPPASTSSQGLLPEPTPTGPVQFAHVTGFYPPEYTQTDGSPTPTRVRFGLWQTTLAPGAALESPIPGAQIQVVALDPDAPPFGHNPDGTVTNKAAYPIDLYFLTVSPLDETGDTVPS
jgi:hypothetical protein